MWSCNKHGIIWLLLIVFQADAENVLLQHNVTFRVLVLNISISHTYIEVGMDCSYLNIPSYVLPNVNSLYWSKFFTLSSPSKNVMTLNDLIPGKAQQHWTGPKTSGWLRPLLDESSPPTDGSLSFVPLKKFVFTWTTKRASACVPGRFTSCCC